MVDVKKEKNEASLRRQKRSSSKNSNKYKKIFIIHNAIILLFFLFLVYKTGVFSVVFGNSYVIYWEPISYIIYLSLYMGPMIFLDLFVNGSWYNKQKSVDNLFLFFVAIGVSVFYLYMQSIYGNFIDFL